MARTRNQNTAQNNAIPWIKRNLSFLSWAGTLLVGTFWIGWYIGSTNSKMEMFEKISTLQTAHDKELREITNENIRLVNELSIERSKKHEQSK